ncbi:MAG TPA: 5-dehydro-4-deoxyglucarate dehydratase [Galbitalea sp.]|jgi:5-dehydro-4-deoxyglucarate dehydratase|nr:5-dehydro-4-deoxyglucarate dehydratase [Galbitalea sp.]
MTSSPQELAQKLGAGLLSFPVTHFRSDHSFDRDSYTEHVELLSKYSVAGLFAAGGTGEFSSLLAAEVEVVVAATIEAAGGTVPVVAPAGRSVAEGRELARAAEAAGADGILLFPQYLTEASQDGLGRYVTEIASATGLGVIIYSRANAVYSPELVARLADQVPNLVGFKDGVGNLELITRISSRVGDRLVYVGGLPTAEVFALPYLELGVTTYSSAMFNFVPDFALDFYGAVRAHDRTTVFRMLKDFVIPFTAIRDRTPGYAVSIIKAGMTAIGRSAGPVRPPLSELAPDDYEELRDLIARASVSSAGRLAAGGEA